MAGFTCWKIILLFLPMIEFLIILLFLPLYKNVNLNSLMFFYLTLPCAKNVLQEELYHAVYLDLNCVYTIHLKS